MGRIEDLSTCTLRQACRIARALGVEVRQPRRTGELLFVHPVGGRVRHNARRKDASRALMLLLRKVSRTAE